MEFEKGQVVVSVSGHDKGDLFVITGFDGDMVLICNGKSRRLDSPKRKNPKHINSTVFSLREETMASNQNIRKQLNRISTMEG